jgi:hypothetical protein
VVKSDGRRESYSSSRCEGGTLDGLRSIRAELVGPKIAGRFEEAVRAASRATQANPRFSVAAFVGTNFTSAKNLAAFGTALRVAGIPET